MFKWLVRKATPFYNNNDLSYAFVKWSSFCDVCQINKIGESRDLFRPEPVSLRCSHRVDPQTLEEPCRADGEGLAVDEGVVLWRDVLQDRCEIGSRAESGFVVVHQLDVVDVTNLLK